MTDTPEAVIREALEALASVLTEEGRAARALAALDALVAENAEAIERGQNLVDGIGMEREMRKDAEAENVRLTAELTKADGDGVRLLRERDEALRVAAELRAALEAIVKHDGNHPRSAPWTRAGQIALAALSSEGQPREQRSRDELGIDPANRETQPWSDRVAWETQRAGE